MAIIRTTKTETIKEKTACFFTLTKTSFARLFMDVFCMLWMSERRSKCAVYAQ